MCQFLEIKERARARVAARVFSSVSRLAVRSARYRDGSAVDGLVDAVVASGDGLVAIAASGGEILDANFSAIVK